MKKNLVFICLTLLALSACKSKKSTKMKKMNVENFVADYIETWSTQNSKSRQQLVNKVYSEKAEFYADEPGDEAVKHFGLDAIFTNITQVNERLVIGNSLITESTGFSKNHKAIRVSWQMKTPTGEVAVKGMNLLILNESGKIKKDFIFIN